MGGGWIALDDVPEAELPDWARQGTGNRVMVAGEGLAHVRDGRGSVARWSEVLGVTVVHGIPYVLVPRRPPRPPWLTVTADMLPEALRDGGTEAFVRAVEARREGRGYREAQPSRQPLPVDDLERRIRAREPIPGAVEVPVRAGGGDSSPAKATALIGGISYGLFGGIPIAFLLARATGHEVLSAVSFFFYVLVLLATAVGTAVVYRVAARADDRERASTTSARMLVMTPDGCMLALEGGARAMSWREIGAFAVAGDPSAQRTVGQSWLVVRAPDGSAIGAIDGSWFDAPLSLIVAVANTYRAEA